MDGVETGIETDQIGIETEIIIIIVAVVDHQDRDQDLLEIDLDRIMDIHIIIIAVVVVVVDGIIIVTIIAVVAGDQVEGVVGEDVGLAVDQGLDPDLDRGVIHLVEGEIVVEVEQEQEEVVDVVEIGGVEVGEEVVLVIEISVSVNPGVGVGIVAEQRYVYDLKLFRFLFYL